MSESPTLRRMRHETRRRSLRIAQIKRLTPSMIRVVAGGPPISSVSPTLAARAQSEAGPPT